MPCIAEVFSYGDSVRVDLADGSVFEGYLKQQYNGQLNTRIWV
jgi:hypothetical protein